MASHIKRRATITFPKASDNKQQTTNNKQQTTNNKQQTTNNKQQQWQWQPETITTGT
jgi:hypothetical protein